MNSVFSFHQNNTLRQVSYILMMLGILILSGCASTQISEDGQEVTEVDPYENVNRKIYEFNDTVDEYVAEPISSGYKYITPQFVQTGVSNFFSNLKNINTVLNDVLQAKFQQGAQDTGRFAINSTLGLLGLFDVATEIGLEENEEDFEQTLAVWGVPQGSYLVLPLLGPSTTRGIPGAVLDTAANPASYVGFPVQLVQMLNARANAEGALNFIDEAALDPYVFTRESFLQWRKHLATDGNAELQEDEMLELEDELFDDEGDDSSDVNVGADAEVKVEPVKEEKPKGFTLDLTTESGNAQEDKAPLHSQELPAKKL